jgi:hypothetical protein
MIERVVANFGGRTWRSTICWVAGRNLDAGVETAENFDRVNVINIRGVWACMKHELRQMPVQQGGGAIPNCS